LQVLLGASETFAARCRSVLAGKREMAKSVEDIAIFPVSVMWR